MILARTASIALVLSIATATGARAQSLTAETTLSGGISSEQTVSAAAAQLRFFGDAELGIRYFAELSWGATSDRTVDAFGAAYPYGNQVDLVEAYGERLFKPGAVTVGIRGGRYRTPFGISAGSDYAYAGFSRAPLIRYDGYFALSNNFLETGVDAVVGVPRLSFEASVGQPSDIGEAIRRSTTDTVVRVQGYAGNLIAGVSYINTSPYQPATFAFGRSEFVGIDARYMVNGIQLRGEFLSGRPFDGVTTKGWYVDTLVHRLAMGPVTAVGRIEELDYDTPFVQFVLHTKRQTIGARVRVLEGLSVQVNAIHQTGQLQTTNGSGAVDVGVSYTFRIP